MYKLLLIVVSWLETKRLATRPVSETDHFTPHQINELAYSLNLELNFVYNTDMRKGNYIGQRSRLKMF